MEQHPEAKDLDSNESLNLEGDRTANLSSSLKRMVMFIVFSLGLALFFSLFSLFPHSFSVYFSTFLFSLLNHALERKYMFLICNGILFLLATSSSSYNSPNYSSFGLNYNSFSHSDDHHFDQHDLVAAIDESSSEEEEEKNQEMEIEEELNEEDEGCFTDEVEEEDEEEETLGSELEVVVSTQELNKKFEEFIRKMKEEMRIEAAQNHLIAV